MLTDPNEKKNKALVIQMANPTSRGQQRDKPFRDALRMEAALAESGEDTPAKPGSLRYIARQLLNRAGAETAAAKEIGDRLDGKPAQAIVGDDEADPISVRTIVTGVPRASDG